MLKFNSLKSNKVTTVSQDSKTSLNLGTILLAFLFSILFSTGCFAQGNLILYPRRVIFEGAKHIEEVNLANTGKDTATYQVSVLEMRMKDDGNFQEIFTPDSGQLFAEPYIRIFPRKVTLGPNETQVVKVQLSTNARMKAGEYRSHLYFRAVQMQKPKGAEDETDNSKGISVRITPIFGISIPVLIRVGEQKTTVQISKLKLTDKNEQGSILNMTLSRTGTNSMYGNILIDYIKDGSHSIRIAEADGVAVYTPNSQRQIRIQLPKHKGVDYNTGKIDVLYQSSPESKVIKYAEAVFALGSEESR